ncbi:MAG TPA: LLM class F420-dependent oxidoreductase [Streptosporangiaceae bacterium]
MTAQLREQVGQFGVWRAATQCTPEFAARLEQAGYGTLWLGGSPDGDLLLVDDLLAATSRLTVGTSIVNIWKDDAAIVAESFARIEAQFPGRFVLGIGTGHPEATQEYTSPYEKIATYVAELTSGDVPAQKLVLAALGPRVLRLAGTQAGGAIPYLVPPEHTRAAREILGPQPLLAPEHKVVLDTNVAQARALGRRRVRNPYLGLVNYTSNLRRLGYTDEDLAGDGSDRLIDALVAHGNAEQVAVRLREHLAAGADHVAVQLLTESGTDPMPGYADLARALGL